MYRVRGADGKEYGPVTAEIVRQWMAQGRATAQTQVQAEGSAEWKALIDCPELASALATGLGPPAVPHPSGARPVGPGTTSGLAIAALVLGILGVCSMGLLGVVAVIVGIMAINQIDRSKGQLQGRGLALGGTVAGGLSILLVIPLLAGLMLPALAKAKAKAQRINCMSNLRQLGLAMRMYAMDNNDKLPGAEGWCDALSSSVSSPKVFQCPSDGSRQACSYLLNRNLAGAKLDDLDPRTVMIFEGDGGWNGTGGPEQIRDRHSRIQVVCFADGSVQLVPAAQSGTLRWNP